MEHAYARCHLAFDYIQIDEVVYNNPHTIINWSDGSKTVVKCMEGDEFDEHVGFQAAVTKKVFGSHGAYKRIVKDAKRCP